MLLVFKFEPKDGLKLEYEELSKKSKYPLLGEVNPTTPDSMFVEIEDAAFEIKSVDWSNSTICINVLNTPDGDLLKAIYNANQPMVLRPRYWKTKLITFDLHPAPLDHTRISPYGAEVDELLQYLAAKAPPPGVVVGMTSDMAMGVKARNILKRHNIGLNPPILGEEYQKIDDELKREQCQRLAEAVRNISLDLEDKP